MDDSAAIEATPRKGWPYTRRQRQRQAEAMVRIRKTLARKPPQRLLEVYRRYNRDLAKSPRKMEAVMRFGSGKRVRAFRRAVAVIEGGRAWK